MRKYYTLAVREGGTWSPQFGDHSRGLVAAERFEYLKDYRDKDLRIIETDEAQSSIDAGISALNDWRNP